jgi:1-deoxy-D-xylulose-5-phosphate reductoisomerase
MVAIKDASKVAALKELIKDVPVQPDILVGDEGAVEVRPGGGGRRRVRGAWGWVGRA